jgi:hypothetical protein
MNNSNLIDLGGLDVSDEDIRDSHKGLQSTSTNMLVGLLANSDKLKQTDDRWDFEDDAENHKKDDDRDIDDDIEDYKSKKGENKDNYYTNYNDDNINNKKEDIFIHHDKPKQDGVFIHHDKPKQTQTVESTNNDTEHKIVDREGDAKTEQDMTEEEIMLAKLDMLRKLGELKQYGATLSQNYSLNSNLKSMQYEYRLHSDIRSKQNAVQWMSHMLVGIMKGTEMLNDSYNPFEIKLTGLSGKISNDMQSYYDVLGEIYEKYNQPGKKMAPELRLLLMISGAALSLQMNKILPSMIPGISNTLKNDEDVLNELKQKASQTSDKHRNELNNMASKEHVIAAQKVSDIEMIRRKELEYKKLKKEAENTHLKDDLALSTESPGMFGNVSNGTLEKDEELQKIQINNLAKQQKIHEMKTFKNNRTSQKIRQTQLNEEKSRLDMILRNLTEDDNQANYDDIATEQSSESTISVNPSIDILINKNKSSSAKQASTKKSKLKDLGVAEGISIDDITVGSNDKKKRKTTKMRVGS